MDENDKLAYDHWSYIEKVLEAHAVDEVTLSAKYSYLAGFKDGLESMGGETPKNSSALTDTQNFHYKTAFIHGAKHAKQQQGSY